MIRSSPTTCTTCGSSLDATVDGLCPTCLLQFGWRGFGAEIGNQPASAPPARQRVGEYELRGEIARGGMGVVYRARQIGLERDVALKMILVGHWASEAQVQRFRLEAQASARLEHPNIVPVYDFGEHEGWHYFSLKLIEGEDLARQLRAGLWPATNLPEQQHIARLVQTVAAAVHFAHQRGILHRDLKPTNILIDRAGTPYLTDFGLAKLIEETSDLTHTSAVIGTPAYMAPEQAAGRTDDVTVAADVYSLGAVLYELLTGQPPHQARTPLETIRQVIEAKIVPPQKSNSALAADLATICRKCLHREPAARYSSARELADDLDRWVRGEPIHARPVSTWERAGYWARRNPLPAALLAGIGLLLIGTAIISTTLAVRMREARDEARLNAAENLRRLVELHTATGVRLVQAGDPLQALPWLVEALRLDVGKAAREHPHRTRIASLLAQSPTLEAMIFHERIIQHAAFSPDGRLVATASYDGTVRVTETDSGREVCPPLPHTNALLGVTYLYFVAFSPDGQRLVSACNHEAQVWDLATGRRALPPLSHTNQVRVAQFSPDGTKLLTGGLDGWARIWKAATGELISELPHERGVLVAAWSSDGKTIATGGRDQCVRLWDAQSGALRSEPLRHERALTHLAFSPDGRYLLAASREEKVRIYDAATGRLTTALEAGTSVHWASFSPDGQSVLASGADGFARLWQWPTAQSPTRFEHPGESVVWTGWSADGQRFLTAGPNQVQVWNFATGERLGPPLGHNHTICHAELSSDGRRVLTGCLDGTGRVWAVPELGSQTEVAAKSCGPFNPFALSRNAAGAFQLWDALTGQFVSGALPLMRLPEMVSYSDTTRRLAVLDEGQVRLFDGAVTPPAELAAWSVAAGCKLHLSPDGETLFLSQQINSALVSARDGVVLQPLPHPNQVRHVAFHPDGIRLLTVCDDRAVRLWDRQTGELLAPPMWHTDIPVFAAFSPDGQLAMTTGYDGAVRLWNFATGEPAVPPLHHVGLVYYAAFNSDGRLLVTFNDQGARVWDWAKGRALTAPLPAPLAVQHLDFTPDSRHLLMVLADRSPLYWELPSGLPLTWPGRSSIGTELASLRGLEKLPIERRSVAELQEVIRLITGYEIHDESGLVPVDAARLRQTWEAHAR